MPLNTLLERGRTVAEYGRALAEGVPYSLVALVSRFAVASVFWRSGQTKVHGFHIREEVLFREEYKVPLLQPVLGRRGDVCRQVGREQGNLVLLAEQNEGFFADVKSVDLGLPERQKTLATANRDTSATKL